MDYKVFTKPVHVTTWMGVFLALVAGLAAFLVPQLKHAFMANAAFNGVIVFVLAVGIAVNLRQVWRLQREVLWIESFQQRPEIEGLRPVLLAPMARLLASRKRGQVHLSPASMRTLLDSVQIRLEEQRDLSRYLIGLLIFLGLLGTFWGLLVTIRSIGEIIGGMSVGTDPVAMFEALKSKLDTPLGGMATSFSTSLFGLAGSLIVGFLDLQSGHAQNRFYNELEEWLSHITRLPSSTGIEGDGNVPAYVQALLEQTVEGLDRMQRSALDSERERRTTWPNSTPSSGAWPSSSAANHATSPHYRPHRRTCAHSSASSPSSRHRARSSPKTCAPSCACCRAPSPPRWAAAAPTGRSEPWHVCLAAGDWISGLASSTPSPRC